MKRMFIYILVFTCLLSLTACAGKEEPVVFYYPNAEITYNTGTGVITPETREALSRENSLSYLLSFYLEGPISPNLRTPVPENTQLLRIISYDGGILLVMSREFAQLEGVDLTVACTCISRTCFDLTDFQEVTIASGNQKNVLRVINRDSTDLTDSVIPTTE